MIPKEKVKRMNRVERRKQILNAAMEVFVEKGFIRSTTLEIAKKAGVSEVTLFRYFSSKQEIFLQGVEPILITTLEESINDSGEVSVEAKLEHILYERIRLISKNHQIVKLILSEASLLTELGSESFMDKIIKIIQSMLNQTGVHIVDNAVTLRLLMGSMLSFLYMPENDEETIQNYIRKVVPLILNKK